MTTLKLGVIGSAGQGYTPGHWRADPPTGTPIAEPAKPEPVPLLETVSERDARPRDPRTKANMEAHAEALAPRRWRPAGDPA